MEKTIEKLKKEYNELCKRYEITMEKYTNVNDFIYAWLDIILYGSTVFYVSEDYIKVIENAVKDAKVRDDFLNACTKKDARNLLNNEVTQAYVNQLIDDMNQYKVELEDMLPIITTVGKILSSEDPIQGILEYGESCPIVKEALKEEWIAYLKECEKIRPHNIRLTTNEIAPDTYIRVPEAKPKKLLYGSKDKIKINK